MAAAPKASFSQITKHPITYALMVIVVLLVKFADSYSDSNDAGRKYCEKVSDSLRAEKKDLTIQLSESRREMNNLYNELLIKNNIINQAVGTGVDSFVRRKLQPKVIENLQKQ